MTSLNATSSPLMTAWKVTSGKDFLDLASKELPSYYVITTDENKKMSLQIAHHICRATSAVSDFKNHARYHNGGLAVNIEDLGLVNTYTEVLGHTHSCAASQKNHEKVLTRDEAEMIFEEYAGMTDQQRLDLAARAATSCKPFIRHQAAPLLLSQAFVWNAEDVTEESPRPPGARAIELAQQLHA